MWLRARENSDAIRTVPVTNTVVRLIGSASVPENSHMTRIHALVALSLVVALLAGCGSNNTGVPTRVGADGKGGTAGGEQEPSAEKKQAIKELKAYLRKLREEVVAKEESNRASLYYNTPTTFPGQTTEHRLREETKAKAIKELADSELARLVADNLIKKTNAYNDFIRKWGPLPADIDEPDPNATEEKAIPPAEPTKTEEKEPRPGEKPSDRPAEPPPVRRDEPTPVRPPGGV